MLPLQQDNQWWTIVAYCNVGWTVIQPKPSALRYGGNWKQKLKIGSLDKFGNVFKSTHCEKGAERLNVHERCYITLSSKQSLQQSRKRKEKENIEKNSTIPEQ